MVGMVQQLAFCVCPQLSLPPPTYHMPPTTYQMPVAAE